MRNIKEKNRLNFEFIVDDDRRKLNLTNFLNLTVCVSLVVITTHLIIIIIIARGCGGGTHTNEPEC